MTHVSSAVTLFTTTLDSPIGPLQLHGDAESLHGVWMPEHRGGPTGAVRGEWQPDPGPFRAAVDQLEAYFAGDRTSFDLPTAAGGTAFQQAVWAALVAIPYGETRSYGQLAEAVGRPRAVRAVGTANARNPLSIVVPCHRVVGSSGDLTGYAGGTARKRWLLDHERGALPL